MADEDTVTTSPGTADGTTRWNYSAFVGQGTSADVSTNLGSPGMVLPFLFAALGGSVLFAGLILPLYTGASLVFGWLCAPLVVKARNRKWFVAAAGAIDALALAAIAVFAFTLPPSTANYLFLGVAVILGIAKGVSSLAYQDLVGRALPSEHRQRMYYLTSALSGVITIIAALVIARLLAEDTALQRHVKLLWISIGAMALSAALTILIREAQPSSSTKVQKPKATGLWQQLVWSKEAFRVDWYRRYLVTRALLSSVTLAVPFYAMHAAALHAHKHHSLAAFVIATSGGYVIGSLIWQRVAKKSVRLVFVLCTAVAVVAGGIAIAMDMQGAQAPVLMHSAVFLLISVASIGIYNASGLYFLEQAEGPDRPLFVALTNTLLGGLAVLIAFIFGLLAHIQGVVWPIYLILALNVLAGFATRLLAGRPNPDEHPEAA